MNHRNRGEFNGGMNMSKSRVELIKICLSNVMRPSV